MLITFSRLDVSNHGKYIQDGRMVIIKGYNAFLISLNLSLSSISQVIS